MRYLEMLNGRKTYLAAGLLAAFAIIGAITGQLEAAKVGELLVEALALVGLRHAVGRSNLAK